MRRGRPANLTNADIALAMELRTEGVPWKIISYGLGLDDDHKGQKLIEIVKYAERRGYRRETPPALGTGIAARAEFGDPPRDNRQGTKAVARTDSHALSELQGA